MYNNLLYWVHIIKYQNDVKDLSPSASTELKFACFGFQITTALCCTFHQPQTKILKKSTFIHHTFIHYLIIQ